ncbi:hypothetical protein ACIRCZ_04550 [Leifsonia sp. NPDC102414]|uniref:hypothetical protein n=1 Tax=unclassified Leifsonia TaxID=2663824 RepID=UPI000AEE1F80|nr:hypothetical protein [Leifsonia sp. Root227]
MSDTATPQPELGLTVPGWSVRALFGVIAVALCVTVADSGFWVAVSLALTAAAVAVPRWLTAWFLIGALAFTVLLHPQSLEEWRVYALIAGAHALHIAATWMLVVPPFARLQPAVLLPSLRRFVLIQVPVQAATAGLLALTGAAHGSAVIWPAVLAGVAVAALVLVAAPVLLRRPHP